MKIQQLPSGLILAEHGAPDPPKPKQYGVTCSYCGKVEMHSTPAPFIFSHRMDNGWQHHSWSCKCAPSYACPECEETLTGCQVCGRGEELC